MLICESGEWDWHGHVGVSGLRRIRFDCISDEYAVSTISQSRFLLFYREGVLYSIRRLDGESHLMNETSPDSCLKGYNPVRTNKANPLP